MLGHDQAGDAAGDAVAGGHRHGRAQALGPQAGGGRRRHQQGDRQDGATAGIDVTKVTSTSSSMATSRASTG
jgi:hypothetical protein